MERETRKEKRETNYVALGERIRRRREEMQWGVSDLAKRLQTSVKYVRAMEENDYCVFTAKVYARGFLGKIADLLFPDTVAEILREFDTEWEIDMLRRKQAYRPSEASARSPLVTPARLWAGTGVAVGIFFLIFFGSAVIRRVASPGLVIAEPEENAVYTGPRVQFRGIAPAESRLTVNARNIQTGQDGRFGEEIEVGQGIQRLEFVLTDKFDRVKKVVRYIYVK